MRKVIQLLKSTPAVRAVLSARRRRYRRALALEYYAPKLAQIDGWLISSNEITNFTYDLTPRSRRYLASTLSIVLRKELGEISRYFDELDQDTRLRDHIRQMTLQSDQKVFADPVARYARRIGWYACVRALKPRVVVETGVEKGLGSLILTAALMKNQMEGFAGRYYGTDIAPDAGYLFTAPFTDFGRILRGDSITSLQALDEQIDIFVNDSDHSAEYEAREYQTVRDKLSPRALIIGDNAHVTDELSRFAEETGRNFLYFGEEPLDHWYPGAGMGIAFNETLPVPKG